MSKTVVKRLQNLQNEIKTCLSMYDGSNRNETKTVKVTTTSISKNPTQMSLSNMDSHSRNDIHLDGGQQTSTKRIVNDNKPKDQTDCVHKKSPGKPYSAPSGQLSPKEGESYLKRKRSSAVNQRVPRKGEAVEVVESSEWFDCSQNYENPDTETKTLRSAQEILTDIHHYGTDQCATKRPSTWCAVCRARTYNCSCRKRLRKVRRSSSAETNSQPDESEDEDLQSAYQNNTKKSVKENSNVRKIVKKFDKNDMENVVSSKASLPKQNSHSRPDCNTQNSTKSTKGVLKESNSVYHAHPEQVARNVVGGKRPPEQMRCLAGCQEVRPITAPVKSDTSGGEANQFPRSKREWNESDDEMGEKTRNGKCRGSMDMKVDRQHAMEKMVSPRVENAYHCKPNLNNFRKDSSDKNVHWGKDTIHITDDHRNIYLSDSESSTACSQAEDFADLKRQKNLPDATTKKIAQIIEKSHERVEEMRRSRQLALTIVQELTRKYDEMAAAKKDMADKLQSVLVCNLSPKIRLLMNANLQRCRSKLAPALVALARERTIISSSDAIPAMNLSSSTTSVEIRLSQLTLRIRSFQEQNDKLIKDVKEAHESSQQILVDWENYRKENSMTVLMNKIKMMNAENEGYKNKIRYLEEQLIEKSQFEDKSNDVTGCENVQNDQGFTGKDLEISELQKKVYGYHRLFKRQEVSHRDLIDKVNILENMIRNSKEKEKSFAEAKAEFKKIGTRYECKLQRLTAEKMKLIQAVNDLRIFGNERQAKLESLMDEVKKKDEELEKHKKLLQEKCDTLEEANSELESIRKKSSDLEEQVRTLRKSIENFDQMHQNLLKERQNYEELMQRMQGENTKLQEQLSNEKDSILIKDKIIDDQQATIKQMREKAEEMKGMLKKNQSLERLVNIEREEKMELQETVEHLKFRKEQLKQRVKSLEGDLLLAPQEVVRDLQKTQIVLHDLENQVQIKQKEWEIHLQSLIREKEQACNVAAFATRKLMQTTSEFQRQSDVHKKLYRMLAENLAEKEKHLHEANEKAKQQNVKFLEEKSTAVVMEGGEQVADEKRTDKNLDKFRYRKQPGILKKSGDWYLKSQDKYGSECNCNGRDSQFSEDNEPSEMENEESCDFSNT